jgi:hypothetical protein
MKKLQQWSRARGIMIILFSLLLFLGGCTAFTQQSGQSSGATVQSRSGLSVIYIYQKYRNVDQVPTGKAALRMGRRGAPVPVLNHQSGKEDSVLASGRSQGVGMVLEGFLDLKKTGTYRWQALANDGVRMFIDEKMIFEDPKVHGDRLTPVGTIQVSRAGRHPVRIVYFQRKGTAALKLYWQPPGADGFSLVPAEVYRH